jgi:hypothetical protein
MVMISAMPKTPDIRYSDEEAEQPMKEALIPTARELDSLGIPNQPQM